MCYRLQTLTRYKLLPQFFCVLPAIFFLNPLKAQSFSGGDTVHFYQQIYQSRIGGSSLLYNGPEYTASYPETNGSQFLNNGRFINGTVWYDGVCYRNISLEFDLVAGLLVTKSLQGLNMVLLTQRVDSFTIGKRKFVRLEKVDPTLPLGYYEKLYEDKIVALVKRNRQSVRSLHLEEGNHFVDRNSYVLKLNDHFHTLTNKKSLLSIFHSQAKELRKFWKEEQLDYKKDPEKTILRTSWWYTQQKNGG